MRISAWSSDVGSSDLPVGRLLDWLGLLHSRRGATLSADPCPGGPPNLSRQMRHDLVATIGNFLIDHQLDISPANLLIAHSAFSGSNPQLARRIAQRAQTAEGIDQPWMDEMGGEDEGRQSKADLDRLIARLETNLETFQTRSKAAHQMTRDYGSELEDHQIGRAHV